MVGVQGTQGFGAFLARDLIHEQVVYLVGRPFWTVVCSTTLDRQGFSFSGHVFLFVLPVLASLHVHADAT